jgi:5-methylcytosine-specific restriction enzyme A
MPRKPLHACTHPGCPALTSGGACDAHRKQRNREYSQARRDRGEADFYNGMRWRNLRRWFLCRNPLCVECQQPAEHADHIVPVRNDPSRAYDVDNLRPYCRACHSRRHAADGSRWGQSQ